MKYIIGSRGSRLALIQTKYVQEKLAKAYPEHSFEIEVIKTKGDKIQNKPLDKIGGKGLFVKEIEEKIISGEIHMGVHSMKDMPSTPAKGLVFTKSWKREDPRDVLILRTASNLSDLRKGAVIGTGSKRRAFQLLKQRPDLKIVNIRGNVDTRLRKMEEQEFQKEQTFDMKIIKGPSIEELISKAYIGLGSASFIRVDEVRFFPSMFLLIRENDDILYKLRFLQKIQYPLDQKRVYRMLDGKFFMDVFGRSDLRINDAVYHFCVLSIDSRANLWKWITLTKEHEYIDQCYMDALSGNGFRR